MNGGSNWVTGGSGNDVFMFRDDDGAGRTVINDFQHALDLIAIQDAHLDVFSDLVFHDSIGMAATSITTSSGMEIFLMGVTSANLSAVDFAFI